MAIQIVYPSEKYFASFHQTLSQVASERVYIEMIEAPPLEKVSAFQKGLIAKNGPVYGGMLLQAVLDHAKRFGLEKVELHCLAMGKFL